MSWDLRAFDRMKASDPKRYRSMKIVLRFNGPMVILLMGFMMLDHLVRFASNELPVWDFVLFEIIGLLFCVISVRWFLWSLKRE